LSNSGDIEDISSFRGLHDIKMLFFIENVALCRIKL